MPDFSARISCDRLLADGHDVICVDNFFTGRKQNIEHLIGHPRFELMRHDVTLPLYVEVDEIYNLACPASPVHYQHDPVQTTKTSVLGAINMLGLAKRLKCRIFQASTSEVYGDPSVHPQTERYWGNVNPIGPRACYDEGKRCAETLFFDYHRQHDLDIKVARIFNTYGPRMHPNDGRVVSNFIVQALQGQADHDLRRRQADALVLLRRRSDRALRAADGSPADLTGPINLGNPGEFTISELAELVIEMTGSRSKLSYLPLPQDDPKQRRPDIGAGHAAPGLAADGAAARRSAPTIEHFDRCCRRAAPASTLRAARPTARALRWPTVRRSPADKTDAPGTAGCRPQSGHAGCGSTHACRHNPRFCACYTVVRTASV